MMEIAEEWLEKVKECAMKTVHEIEDVYKNGEKAARLHLPKTFDRDLENEGKVVAVFLDGLVGVAVWIVSKGGRHLEQETEAFLVEAIKERFNFMRSNQKFGAIGGLQ